MYKIKVKYQPIDKDPNVLYKPKTIEGLYVPKGTKASFEKIKEQVKLYILKNLTNKEKYPSVTLQITDVQITRIPFQFILFEDKLD